MKQFAGIDLESLNSMESLREARDKFIANYRNKYSLPGDCSGPEEVIEPLRNFIRVNNIPTRSATQALAVLIKYLPNDEDDSSGCLQDDLKLLVLKLNLRQNGCGGASRYAFRYMPFKERHEMVERLRRKIYFPDDLAYYAKSIHESLNRKFFAMADKKLEKIINFSNINKKSLNREYLPYALSLQISYYIEIMDYLRERRYTEDLEMFYNRVLSTLVRSLVKLMQLPEIKEAKTGYIWSLFFSKDKHTKYNQIQPELIKPLLDKRIHMF